jgi:hypothetical protein
MRPQAVTALAVLAVLLLTVGSGAFGSGSLVRGTSLGIGDDTTSYIGYDSAVDVNETGTTANLSVTLANRGSSSPLVLTVFVGAQEHVTTLGPGETATFEFANVACGESVTVTAVNDDVEATLERTVDC